MGDDEVDEILRNAQRGDEAAYAELVGEFHERIFRLAWRITGDAGLAEEASAQTLFKLWRRAHQWRGDCRAATWIYRIAVRTALDAQRSQQRWWRRWAHGTLAATDGRPNPAEQVELDEERQLRAARLESLLLRLSPADRALLHLHYYENRGLMEIEAILGVSRDALKMRLSRARKRLKQLWETRPGS